MKENYSEIRCDSQNKKKVENKQKCRIEYDRMLWKRRKIQFTGGQKERERCESDAKQIERDEREVQRERENRERKQREN